MLKRLLPCLICAVLLLSLCGCWSYQGLDHMSIVAGMAIDYDKDRGKFLVSYEVADPGNAEKKSTISGKVIKAEGDTLFDAARNAKRREPDQLFFGSANIVIVSKEIAQDMGILTMVEWLLRDSEFRETMSMAISGEETAGALLEKSDEMHGLISVDLQTIIKEDKAVTSSSINVQLYQIYDMLKSPVDAATLPVLRRVKNGESELNEVGGIAVFKSDKLAGYLTAEESKYALMVNDHLEEALLILSMEEPEKNDLSLLIVKNKTKKAIEYDQEKVTVKIETSSNVIIGENRIDMQTIEAEIVEKMQDKAARMIEEKIQEVVGKVQREFKADAFGFGDLIYRKNLSLWRELAPLWADIYPEVEVQVTSKVQIINSAFIK